MFKFPPLPRMNVFKYFLKMCVYHVMQRGWQHVMN